MFCREKTNFTDIKNKGQWNSLAVHWLRLHASTAGTQVRSPGQGTKIPQTALYGQKKKEGQKPKENVGNKY